MSTCAATAAPVGSPSGYSLHMPNAEACFHSPIRASRVAACAPTASAAARPPKHSVAPAAAASVAAAAATASALDRPDLTADEDADNLYQSEQQLGKGDQLPSEPPQQQQQQQQQKQQQQQQVLVCTNKSCRRLGSLETLDYFRGLSPPHVDVASTGCLGRCGAGPNVAILPQDLFVSHCSTAAHVARLLELQCGAADAATNLRAFELKGKGGEAFLVKDFKQAEALFTQAIDLGPSGGLHNLLCNRSAARAAQGKADLALEDARAAAALKPDWSPAVIRQAEAHAAGGQYQQAMHAYHLAAQVDAEFRRGKTFLRKLKELEQLAQQA